MYPALTSHAKATHVIDRHSSLTMTSDTDRLIDPFHRNITYLRLSVTDICNFRCDYCLPNGYSKAANNHETELTVEEIKQLVHACAQLGIKKVRITGGEPSIRRDLSDIIRVIAQTPGIDTVAMSTNGYQLRQHYQDWANAGLNQLNISIDSFDAETFAAMTGHDILDDILIAIDEIIKNTHITIKINAVLKNESAFTNVMDALDYIKTRPVTYRLIELMETTNNKDVFFAEHAKGERITHYLTHHGWKEQPRDSRNGPAIDYQHQNFTGRIGMITPYSDAFCESCNRIRVSSTGNVHLCLFDNAHHNIRPLLHHQDSHSLAILKHQLTTLLQQKPPKHYLQTSNNGIMHNLSLIGG